MKSDLSFPRPRLTLSQGVWALLGLLITITTANGIDSGYRPGAANFRIKAGRGIGELDSLIAAYNITLFDSIPSRDTYFSTFPETISVGTVVSALQNEDCVLWAEPDFYLYDDTNDPLYNDEWHLENQIEGFPDWADIQAPEAWAIETGDCDVRVAILDSGIPYDDEVDSLTHEDLCNDPGECPIVLRPRPPYQNMNDTVGHGTLVAGILAARTDNELGVAGVAHGSAMVIYKCLTIASDFALCVNDAIDPNGGDVDIISMSKSDPEGHSTIEDAVEDAWEADVLLIFSAGNISEGDTTPDICTRYPCGYSDSLDNVLCVGGTDRQDEYLHDPDGFRAQCYDEINISGPAHHVVTTDIGGSSSYIDSVRGTSTSTPIVAGVAALVLSQARESGIELSAREIRDIITSSADDCNYADHPGRDDSLGYGRVNAFKALLRTPGTKELESDLTIPAHHYNSHSPYVLVDALVVPEDRTLIIEAGTRICFADGASLEVFGTLTALGTAENPIIFEGMDENCDFSIYALGGSSVVAIENAVFDGAYFQFSDGSPASFTTLYGCTFQNDATITVFNGSYERQIIDSCLFTNIENDAAIYVDHGSATIRQCRFERTKHAAIEGYYTTVRCEANRLDSCGWWDDTPSFGGTASSVELEHSTGQFWCNQLYAIPHKGIYAENTSYVTLQHLVGKDKYPGYNEFEGKDGAKLLWLASSSNVYCTNGYNYFSLLDDGYYGYGTGLTKSQNMYYNCWLEPGAHDSVFHPDSMWYNWNFTGTCGYHCMISVPPPPSPPGHSGGGQLDEETVESLYEDAVAAANVGDYEFAATGFRSIIAQYADHSLASASVAELFWAVRESQGDLSELISEMESLRDNLNTPMSLSLAARNYIPLAEIAQEDYEAALSTYRNIIENPLSVQDSIYAVIDSQLTAILASGGNRAPGDPIAAARARALSIRRMRELGTTLRQKFAGLLSEEFVSSEIPRLLPEKFELFSAFPNPFNSAAVIKFALPEKVQVRLEVFNILGQKIATLIHEPMAAGFHSAVFDASHLGSGVYIYRIKAGDFVDSKKMVLIR